MSPAQVAHHAYGEIVIEHLIPGIVVRDCCDAGKQVFQATPNQANTFRYREVLFDRRSFRIDRYRGCPFRGVGVWPAAESWEKAEFQMIVRVDQPREQEITGKIDYGSAIMRRPERSNATAPNHQVHMLQRLAIRWYCA